MQLSTHFDSEEFEHGTAIPDDCLVIIGSLCKLLLEPIRSYLDNEPIEITSGYRSPESNAAAHGISDSEHIATPQKCAADFTFNTTFGKMRSVRSVFDWLRNNPDLPFHQLILEHGANGSSVIHISLNRDKPGVRSVLEGSTHNASPYIAWEHVPFSPTGSENA